MGHWTPTGIKPTDYDDDITSKVYIIKEESNWTPIFASIEYKVLLLILKARLGVASKYLRNFILPSRPHVYFLFALWINSLFPGLGQLWLSLGPSLLSVPPCEIVFCRSLAIRFSSLLNCLPL